MVDIDRSKKTLEDVIQNCTQMIERSTMVAGVGNKMRNPLLSIFLGHDAANHMPQVRSAYFSCWSAEARKLISLDGLYSPDELSMALAEASRVSTAYYTKNELRTIWYWSIMDDDEDFERQFACVRQKVSGPVGVLLFRHLFIFCSQQDRTSQEKTRDRLERLIQWSKDAGESLLILSDASRQGLLDDKGIAENYHMAASIVLMLNSAPTSGKEDVGKWLDFRMRQESLWTASYCACSKNAFDIIGVSLLTIIDRYNKMGGDQARSGNIQTRLCGEGGNYITFLDRVFDEVIAPLCPDEQQIGFWADLPHTLDMVALEQKLSGEQKQSGGVFGRLFKKSTGGNPDNAIFSVQDFWNACVAQYYTGPVRQWLDSPEGNRKVMDEMYGRMAMVLTLDDMKTQLEAERIKLEREAVYQKLPLSAPQEGNVSLPAYLHSCACLEVKRQIYSQLLMMLRDIMKELSQNADGFELLLNNVAASLRGTQPDPVIDQAYGNHMKRLITGNPTVLSQKIHPCATETELLEQLEQAFEELVELDDDGVYYYTLQQDMDFQINASAAAASNVIENCFNYKMESAGRLVTLTTEPGEMFCMMNDNLKGLIQNKNIGKQFIINRCDRIERLYLYPVKPGTIQYS